MKNLDVIVTGLNVVDILVRLPSPISPGEKHEVRDLVVQGGAPAGNAACVLAALGWETGFITHVGNDTLSQIARAEFARCKVRDELLINTPDAQPAVSIVEIDPTSGDRTTFYSLQGYRHLLASDIPANRVRDSRLVLVDAYETDAAFSLLEAANASGVPSVLDVETGDPLLLKQLISLGSHIILPLACARMLSGKQDPVEALAELATVTAGQLVVTNGVHGSWALTKDGVLHQPAFVVEVVDTTGCGDAFHGAYASALLDGLALPLCLEFAAFYASHVALVIGGRSWLPSRGDLRNSDLSQLSAELQSHLGQP
ncbi:MAG: PfkB family carbohydrate kinase [Propionivibrio sp.]